MRKLLFFIVFLLVLAAAAFGLMKYEIIPNPFVEIAEPVKQSLFDAITANDQVAIDEMIALGENINQLDSLGKTAIMVAAENNNLGLMKKLVAAGADINLQDPNGWTVLMYAAKNAVDTSSVLYLMNLGADPTLINSDGQNVLNVATSLVRNSAIGLRLDDLIKNPPFDTNWPSGYVVPVVGATISSRHTHLPGARRAYRNGTHEGFDFYGGVVSVPIEYGTPIHAVANGTIIRADKDYVEMTIDEYNEIIATAKGSLSTPIDILDKLRGRQVWIEHPGGFVTRYAHLSHIPEAINVGASVIQGTVIGETGNSGTLEAAQGTKDDPHPHVEIWNKTMYLGDGLEPKQIYKLARQVFGEDAVLPINKKE